jgi:hypothetical protein
MLANIATLLGLLGTTILDLQLPDTGRMLADPALADAPALPGL